MLANLVDKISLHKKVTEKLSYQLQQNSVLTRSYDKINEDSNTLSGRTNTKTSFSFFDNTI